MGKHIKSLMVIGACLLGILFLRSSSAAGKPTDDSSAQSELSYFGDSQVLSIADIIEGYNTNQLEWLVVAPPNADFCWMQDAGLRLFDPRGFPDDFINGLAPVDKDGVVIYPVFVQEHPVTRYVLIYSAQSQLIASVPPKSGYNPDWIALSLNPLLYYSGLSYDQLNSTISVYNPARLMMRYDLILKGDLKSYLQQQAAAAALDLNNITIMMAYSGPPVTNIQFTAMEMMTNGMRLTVAYPFTLSTYPTNCYTNKLEFFICADLVDGYFTSKAVTNVSSTTNWIEWTDTMASISSTNIRFYAVGNADLDTDSDSLTDAREKFMYHSSPTNTDSDYDGLSDYEECINRNTDPNNNDTVAPIAVIDYPANSILMKVMP